MRRLLLASVLSSASGCAEAPEPVTRAVVLRVVAQALPLEVDWDGSVSPNPPDVYVDLNQADPPGPFTVNGPLVRTEVVENVTPGQLPLRLTPSAEAPPVSVQARVRLVVADRDQGGLDDDDTMFASPVFRLASRVGDAVPGDTTTLAFGDDRTRIAVTVRWEAPVR